MKKVKFKTKEFGGLESGTIVEGFLLAEEGNRGLLYFPPGGRDTGCFIIADKNSKGIYIDSKDNWINQDVVAAPIKAGLPKRRMVKL